MNLKCVIVEDQTMFLQMLHNMLEAIPQLTVVATARTKADATVACEKLRPDLLVLDIALPDGEGITVARRLSKLNASAKTIVLSGEASTFVCPADLQLHVHAVLDKTQAFDALAEEIKALLPRNRGDNFRGELTPREKEIFRLIGHGLQSKEIAGALGISVLTVQSHRKKIAEKLGTNGAELMQRALRHYHATLGGKT